MNVSILKIFQIFGIVSAWASQALADGKITLDEAVELAMKLADLLSVKTEIKIPDSMLQFKDYSAPKKEDTGDLSYRPDSSEIKPVED